MGYGAEAIEKAGYIIHDVADGIPLAKAAAGRGLSIQTFHEVISGVRDLAVSYARAREIRADVDVDDALAIADDKEIDPQRARNMIDIRKWRASKHSSRVYGDRIDLNVQQSISITEALDVARSRILRPVCDQLTIDAEVSEPEPTISTLGPTDSVSADEPDIFS